MPHPKQFAFSEETTGYTGRFPEGADEFPTTIGQRGFWFLDQVSPGEPAYNIAVRFRLQGPLRTALLERAFNAIIARHESLRTGFSTMDDEPVQAVAPAASIEVPVIDLRGLPEGGRMEEADRQAILEAERRFDLSVPPLIRATLLRLEEQDHILLVTVHHIVSDGWSIGIISDELGAFYDAFSQGLDDPLPPLPIQYGDFAVWQAEWLKNSSLQLQLGYWKRQLANLTQLEIPTDRQRPPLQTHGGYIDSILLSRELTDALHEYSVRQGATMFMTSLAVLKVLLARYSGQNDICVGSLIAGRNQVETEPLIGLFVNPIVLRTDLSGNPEFGELVGRVRESVLGAMANQDVPFQQIVEEVRPKRDPSRHPIFQVNFIYQRDFVKPLKFGGLTLTAIPSKSPGSIYDLNFFMVERADGWRASCEYNTDLFDAATIRRMLQQFQALLEGVVTDASRRVSEFPLLTREERRRVFVLPPLRTDRNAPTPGRTAVIGPSDDTERQLVKIWEKLLGVKNISITADFFELGGHSLMAARLLTQVGSTFGTRIFLPEFLQSPTIEFLAARVRGSADSSQPPLINWINPNGTKPPLVFLGGPEFRQLGELLGEDQPLIGLPIPPLMDLPMPFRVEDLVTDLVDTLLRVIPGGPYVLGAWCRAGIVAYEMAQVLRSRGREVALLVLLDTPHPGYIRKFQRLIAKPLVLYFFSQKTGFHLKQLWKRGLRGAPSYIGTLLQYSGVKWQRRFRRARYRLEPRSHVPESEALRFAEVDFAFDRHRLNPYAGRILLFRTANLQDGWFRDPHLGWGESARGGLTVIEIPGGHDEILREPAASMVAAHLLERVHKALPTAG